MEKQEEGWLRGFPVHSLQQWTNKNGGKSRKKPGLKYSKKFATAAGSTWFPSLTFGNVQCILFLKK